MSGLKKILILGIGNILLGDEGLGVHIIKKMQEPGVVISKDIELIDGGTAGFDLIPLMQGRRRIVIVDALKSDEKPGSIYRFHEEHLAASENRISLHESGIMEIIRTLRLMGENPEVEIVGVVPENISEFEINISKAVSECIPAAINTILEAALQ
jgi:hydrogenase maturation protease